MGAAWHQVTLRGMSRRNCKFCHKRGEPGQEWVSSSWVGIQKFFHRECYRKFNEQRNDEMKRETFVVQSCDRPSTIRIEFPGSNEKTDPTDDTLNKGDSQ
jgi:hypothetical protein